MTPPNNTKNEQVKRRYFDFMRHADGKSEKTIRIVEKSILQYEAFTKFVDFGRFDQKQAIAYKSHLADQRLAKSTILTRLNYLKRFLRWLSRQDGYKRRVNVDDVEYLSLPEKDIRAATSTPQKPYPTLAMVKRATLAMPCGTALEKRDRALMATCALTGIRGKALVTLRLKHFDKARRLFTQDPREVETKFSKLIQTWILPLDDELETIVLDWTEYLEAEKLFAPHDPLFPKTAVQRDSSFDVLSQDLSREAWKTTTPLRNVFKSAFEAVDLPYHNPHSFRRMIVHEMYKRELSLQASRAWSLNLGHENAQTTLTSYGQLSDYEMERIIRGGV